MTMTEQFPTTGFFPLILKKGMCFGLSFFWGGATHSNIPSHAGPAGQGVPQCLGDTRHSRLEAQVREKNDANSLEQAHRKSGMSLM